MLHSIERGNKEFIFIELSKEEQNWHGANNEQCILKILNNNYAPTNLLMGVIDNKFNENHPKSLKYQCGIGRNLGTSSLLVGINRKQLVIDLLIKNNYIYK